MQIKVALKIAFKVKVKFKLTLSNIVQVSTPVRQYGSAPEITFESLRDRCILVLKLFDKVDPEKVNIQDYFERESFSP